MHTKMDIIKKKQKIQKQKSEKKEFEVDGMFAYCCTMKQQY